MEIKGLEVLKFETFSTFRLYQFALYYVLHFRKLFGYIGSVDKEFDEEFHWATHFVWCCDGKQKIFIWYSCVFSIHSVPMNIKVMEKKEFSSH
jgi:hypothetical protein